MTIIIVLVIGIANKKPFFIKKQNLLTFGINKKKSWKP